MKEDHVFAEEHVEDNRYETRYPCVFATTGADKGLVYITHQFPLLMVIF